MKQSVGPQNSLEGKVKFLDRDVVCISKGKRELADPFDVLALRMLRPVSEGGCEMDTARRKPRGLMHVSDKIACKLHVIRRQVARTVFFRVDWQG